MFEVLVVLDVIVEVVAEVNWESSVYNDREVAVELDIKVFP